MRHGNLRYGCAAGALLVLVGAGGAQAQTAPAAAPSADAVGDIVVTARKRSERLRDVPATVNVYSSETLEQLGATNIEDTVGVTPGLAVTGNGLSPGRDFRQLVIRGVGANSQLEPSTATFIDGVYSPGLSFDSELLDVERVEVLKGPQGTLFGRNTEGGAVNIVLRRPSDEVRAKVGVLYDNFETYQTDLGVSGPLVAGKLFGSAALSLRQSDYFVTQNGAAVLNENPFWPGRDLEQEYNAADTDVEAADGQREVNARGALRWTPDETWDINLSAHYGAFEGVDQAPGPLESTGGYVVDGDQAFKNTSKNYGAALNVEKTLSDLTLNIIAGYEYGESSSPYDFDGTAYRVGNYHDYDRVQESTSLEVRLQSDYAGPLQWLAGLYAFHDKQDNNRWYNFSNMDDPAGAAPQSSYDGLWNQQIVSLERDGVAAFGQLTYAVTPRLEATVGARVSWEKVDVSALERFEFAANGVIGYTPSTVYGWPDFFTPTTNDADWENFSPQASLRYTLSPELTVYGSVARGFKAGSFQVAPVQPSDVVPIEPETTTNYEIGLKGGLFDNSVAFNLAIYHTDIKDQQLQAGVIRGAFTATTINNASSSKVDGAELDARWQVTDRLTLSGNVAYTRGRFEDYTIAPGGGVLVNKAGDPFPYVPELTYFLAAEYRHPVSSGELVFNANLRHVDDTTVGSGATSGDPVHPLPGYDRVDAFVAWETGSWTAKLFAQNLFDEYIILSRWKSFQVQPNAAFWHNRVDAPRRVGVSLTYRY
ncbi:TonB-dependent receptor [Brevundimonas sp.]|uniref:TonB-dependent receptor n=1 Tax=Brevundimonas sp. TaxID=1871086 RepID=UPI0037BE944B